TGQVHGFESRSRLANGAVLWLNMNVAAVKNDGAIDYYVGSVKDITTRKLAEGAVVRSEARFKALFSSNVIGILVADKTGRIIEANDYFLAIVGRTARDLPLDWVHATPREYRSADLGALRELAVHGRATPWEKEFFNLKG